MSATPPIYDLTLMLETGITPEQRQKIVAAAERLIADGGALVNHQEWGPRQTAYEIKHKAEADYELIQFTAAPEILANLQRTLRITDGVIRFRIIKLKPGTPAPPMTRPEPRPTGMVDEPLAVGAAAVEETATATAEEE